MLQEKLANIKNPENMLLGALLYLILCALHCHPEMVKRPPRGVFSTLSNIYDGVFLLKKRLLIVNYFRKKVPSYKFDKVLNTPVLRDLVAFVQFKKHENHQLRSVTFSIVASLTLQLY